MNNWKWSRDVARPAGWLSAAPAEGGISVVPAGACLWEASRTPPHSSGITARGESKNAAADALIRAELRDRLTMGDY
jgi:hypothetical protein